MFGCWLCVKLYNDLVTFWGLGLFGVVFGLWLWDDFSVIIRGHFYRLREYVYLF